METVDEEFLDATLDFIDRADEADKPFFAWFNPSRMHIWTRLKPEFAGRDRPRHLSRRHGRARRPRRRLLDRLDELGIADNTIVIYTTDNGAETFSWPDGGTTPFRGEKNTNWEGGYRVPALIRWPGPVAPRTEVNAIVSAEDWLRPCLPPPASPTSSRSCWRAARPEMRPLRSTSTAMTSAPFWRTLMPTIPGGVLLLDRRRRSRRARYDQYKAVFMEQQAHGLEVWMQPLAPLRAPKISTSGPIRSSAPITRLAATTAGLSSTFSCCCRRTLRWPATRDLPRIPAAPAAGSFSIDKVMDMLTDQNSN